MGFDWQTSEDEGSLSVDQPQGESSRKTTRLTPRELADAVKGDTWIARWLDCWPHAEPPKSFILFTGLAMLGAALGRRVWLDMDPHRSYPMLNLLLIGPSGIGKSTSIVGMGFKLLESLQKVYSPQIIKGAPTPEKLHFDLRPKPHAVIFASELANFFTRQKYMEGMVPYVTELLDYPSYLERRTKSEDIVRVDAPAVSVIGGSTVEWLQEQLPDSATTGGFLARFLIVPEEHKGQRKALPTRTLSKQRQYELEQRREKVFQEFGAIVAQTPEGEMDFEDYEAQDAYSEWYFTHKPVSGHLAPFAQRAGEFVLRLAMLLALSANRKSITKADIETGKILYHYSEAKLMNVVVPFTIQGKLLLKVLQAIGEETVDLPTLRRGMRNFCAAQEVDRLVASLVSSGDIVFTDDKRVVRVK